MEEKEEDLYVETLQLLPSRPLLQCKGCTSLVQLEHPERG